MSAPVLESRDADALAADLARRIPAFVPGWLPPAGGPGSSLLEIYARFLDALGRRIDRTPDKNELAFLDLLGLELLPAQAARAPVVFTPMPQLGDGSAAAGTRLAARPQGGGDPIVFETESAIGLAAARIAEVVSVWPGRDAYADHSSDAIGGRPFTLWQGLQPIRHELYLAHSVHLALAGAASVELDVALAVAGSLPLPIAWQYWDGDLWRDFAAPGPDDDRTDGLTRSGSLTLHSQCAQAQPTTVGGVKSYWVRGALSEPLPPDPTRTLPQIDRIELRTVLERDVGPTGAAGLLPDTAFAGGAKLDATKPFQPFGAAPGPDTTFYVACEEAFSRPGASVTIGIDRTYTAQEKSDIALQRYEVGVNEAKDLVEHIKQVAQALDAALTALIDPATGDLRADATPLFDGTSLEDWYADVRHHMQDALDAVRSLATPAQVAAAIVGAEAATYAAWNLDIEPISRLATGGAAWSSFAIPMAVVAVSEATVVVGLAEAAHALSSGNATLDTHLASLQGDLTAMSADITALGNGDLGAAIRILGAAGSLIQDWLTVAADLASWPPTIFLDQALPQIFTTARARYAEMRRRIDDANAVIKGALGTAGSLEDLLDQLTPEIAAAAAGVVKPKIPKARLAWEYWDGSAWRAVPELTSVAADGTTSAGPRNLRHGRGEIRFTAPRDWEQSMVNSVQGRWLRARIVGGAFATLKLVTWLDQQSQKIEYLAISDPRPPLLDVFSIGYRWVSEPAAPERCLALNDFQWVDCTGDAVWTGSSFAPYAATGDLVPTLYLGFDRPLPTDLIGLYLDIAEVLGETSGPRLEWQYWDGSGWGRVVVDDETGSLALPGMIDVEWPGADVPPAFPLLAGAGSTLTPADARDAAAFSPGDRLWVEQGGNGELATVASVSGGVLATTAPLTGTYARGSVARAGLPRFGVPRTWLRARLSTDGEPRQATVSGLHLNAVWAAQLQTLLDELIGSSTGEPRQTFSFARSPVLRGETIQVRELEGARADVEYPLLVAELARNGLGRGDVRTVPDPVTGKIAEVWVSWRPQPNLLFSGPDDRHYTVERSHGRLIFGDGVNGRIPPAGANSIRAFRYRSGGGKDGNVATGAISQVLSGVVVQSVANPIPAEGGAEGEADTAVLARGPLTVRNRRQALSADDYEALAREASPGVALARVLPGTAADGRPAAGWVTVVVAPRSPDPEPQPSFELRREVLAFLLARTPASLAGRLAVVGPTYRRVGIEAVVAPTSPGLAGAVVEAARGALVSFLHPLTGGPDGAGWGDRSEVCLSDVAAIVEPLAGVDHVETLLLLDRGIPAGDVLTAPVGRLVSAGPVSVRLSGEGA